MPPALPSLLVFTLAYLITDKPAGFDHLDVPTSIFSPIPVFSFSSRLGEGHTIFLGPRPHCTGVRFCAL